MIVGIYLVQAVAFAIISALVAANKNRSALGWGIIGLLFWLFGVIAAIVVSEVEPEKKCPDCAEEIKLEARVCRYCGCRFSHEKVERQVEKARKKNEEHRQRVVKNIIISVVVVISVLLILAYFLTGYFP